MKGDIFLAFEQFVGKAWGFDAWEKIYQEAHPDLQTQGPFVGPGNYPDGDFLKIFERAVGQVRMAPEVMLRSFGAALYPLLHSRMARELEACKTLRALLLSLDGFVHAEVKKLHPDAQPPQLDVMGETETSLVLRYSSRRRLFALVEGLIEGAAAHYGEHVRIERKEGVGPEHADFTISFLGTAH